MLLLADQDCLELPFYLGFAGFVGFLEGTELILISSKIAILFQGGLVSFIGLDLKIEKITVGPPIDPKTLRPFLFFPELGA